MKNPLEQKYIIDEEVTLPKGTTIRIYVSPLKDCAFMIATFQELVMEEFNGVKMPSHHKMISKVVELQREEK